MLYKIFYTDHRVLVLAAVLAFERIDVSVQARIHQALLKHDCTGIKNKKSDFLSQVLN